MTTLIAFSHDPVSQGLIIANALVSGVIVLRILAFQRDGAKHKMWGSLLAWLLTVLYAWQPITLITDLMTGLPLTQIPVDINWASFGINVFMLCVLLRTRGNVVQIFKLVERPR